ncbi:MAG: TIGR03620 family F420-dependent LLM class oxidoreductase [Gammaproteobacteria bacterium]|nr:TIGR03620 family F420-dependent LLM class oxidoreductase [Gammaproteobacteria bacterium]
MNLGKLGVWYFLDTQPAARAAEIAQRIESLGYAALWIPETVGRHPFVHAGWLLSHTKKLVVATGIASIYHREPGVTMAGQRTLAEQSDNRFLLGLGVSHKPMVEGLRGLKYGKPVSAMRDYLAKMDASPYSAVAPTQTPPRVIAALGPKMLELARDTCTGAHPYFSSPDHTAMARDVLGADKWLCVEQKVILESDPQKARTLARTAAQMYLGLPNYRNNWLRSGMTEDDLTNGGSDRFIDSTFAWGTEAAIASRIKAHFDAGASHVCIQPVNPNGVFGDVDWKVLEALAP